MNLLRRSLTVRLLILFLLLAVVPLFVVGYIAYVSGRQRIIMDVEAHLESVAILKEQEIGNWVDHLEHTITWLASSPQMRSEAAVLASHPADVPEYSSAREALVADLRRIEDLEHISPVFLLDSVSGQIIASSDTSWEGRFRETESWFLQGMTDTTVSNMFHSLALGRPTMVVAAPVTDSDGQVLGVLAGHANLEGLSEVMLERSGLGETGETYLVNQGNLLLTDLRFGRELAFKKWIFTEGAMRALEGESDVDLYLDYRQEPVIGAYRWLEDRDMALLAEIDQAEAFAPIVALRSTVLRIGVGVALVVSLLGVLVARTITKPVYQLVEGAKEIGRGNLKHRIEVGATGEIGQLADAFNDMAANLSHSLGETAHGRRLLLALSQAAQAVQRTRTPEEVYRTVGDELVDLGYHVLVATLTEDGEHLVVSHHTFESSLLRTAEKLAGMSVQDFRSPVVADGHHHQVISEGKAVFFEQMVDPMSQALPEIARPLLVQVADKLGIRQGIYAPLRVDEKIHGVLIVTGADLTEADVPAVTAFASQAAIALENARARATLHQRQQWLSTTLRSIGDGVIATDTEGRVTFMNPVAEELTGWLEADAVDRALQGVFHIVNERTREKVENPVNRVLREGSIVGLANHTVLIAKDGSEKPIADSGAPMEDGDGNLIGAVLVFRDITERRRMEQRMREALELNRKIITASPLGITAYRASGDCVLANDAVVKIIGASREQVLRQNFKQIESWRRSGLLEAAQEALSQGEETRREVHVVSTFDRDIWIDCRFIPFESDREPHLMLIADDVSEHKRMQEQIVRQERLAVLGQLAGGVGHELRNPLGAIKNATYFLQMVIETPDPEVEEMLAIMEREVNRSEEIIGGLLDFARTRPPERQAVDVGDLLSDVLARIDVPSGIEVERRLNERPAILADPAQLEQIFDNLIRNAVQAMPEGGRLTVQTKTERAGWLTVSISDTGQGIADEHLENIFKPLFTTKTRGIGLGLAIVKTLVEGHDGTVEVTSDPGEGSTFTVELPIGETREERRG